MIALRTQITYAREDTISLAPFARRTRRTNVAPVVGSKKTSTTSETLLESRVLTSVGNRAKRTLPVVSARTISAHAAPSTVITLAVGIALIAAARALMLAAGTVETICALARGRV